MPIFEYQCKRCDAVFDCILMKPDEKKDLKCSKCGSTDLKKLVSRVRYMAGPGADDLASNVEEKMLRSIGGNVTGKTRQELKELAKKAGERGKKRFESMMDTGKSDSIEY